jgi:phage recombination protein Bet
MAKTKYGQYKRWRSAKTIKEEVMAESLVLNEDIIKKYICPLATNQEVYVFLQLCKAQNLNPFLREAYLIKYGSAPATIVVGKDTFTKRARSIQAFRGFKAGIVVVSNKAVVYREGGLLVKGEELIGGWSEVYRSDLEVPVRIEVTFDEYVGKKKVYKNNEVVGEEVQALREAFPDQFEGMYSPEEMGIEVDGIEYKSDKPATKEPTLEDTVKPGEAKKMDDKNVATSNGIPVGEPTVRKEEPKAEAARVPDEVIPPPEEEHTPPAEQKPAPSGDIASSKQLSMINALCANVGIKEDNRRAVIGNDILKLGEAINSMKEITKAQASTVIKWLQEREAEMAK